MRAVARIFLLFALAGLLSACARGPDAPSVGQDVQARVDALFGRRVLALESFRRQGSAPYRAAEDGTKQAIVYYNAMFKVAEAYDPSDWSGLNPTMIASALGASDDGVSGLRSGRNDPGAELRVYGSVIYRKAGKGWQPADVLVPSPPSAGAIAAGAPGTHADELVRRLADLVQKSPARRSAEDEIIAEELDRALANIQLRLDRQGGRIVVAAGPDGGEYSRFLAALTTGLRRPGPVSIAATEGSVDNVALIERGEARFGLVQSDVAAAAVTGDGIFAGTGPLGHLRAVASLFPESLHVVVRADSGITGLRELAGRRVALGALGSGTRQTALMALAAAGVTADQLFVVGLINPQDALAQLAAGRIDAVVEVVSAPWQQLEAAMRDTGLALLPLDAATIAEVAGLVHGLVPLDIPARTYPGQSADIPTVAATALLVARDDVPESVVTDTLNLFFASAASGNAGVQATRLSRERATTGITIPMHPAAARYFQQKN